MLNETNQAAFTNILHTMTGADGGLSFMQLRAMLESVENEGSFEGQQVIAIMLKFSKLIDIAQINQKIE